MLFLLSLGPAAVGLVRISGGEGVADRRVRKIMSTFRTAELRIVVSGLPHL